MRIAQPFGQSADPGGRIVFDPAGNLYFADTSNALIRKIDTAGRWCTASRAWRPSMAWRSVATRVTTGAATEAQLNNPVDLALDDDGTLYFTDTYNHCVRSIDPAGHRFTPWPARAAPRAPRATMVRRRTRCSSGRTGSSGCNGVLKISDTGNNRIRVIKLR